MCQSDLISNQSSTREEDFLGINENFKKRPFNCDYDSNTTDSQEIENSLHENPFCENGGIFHKHKSIQFENTKRSVHHQSVENWSRDMNDKDRSKTLIRSAPVQTKGSYWDTHNNGERITLPILGCGGSDSIKRISSSTLMVLLCNILQKNFVVVDARFKYEYEGGHIKDALNCSSVNDLTGILDKLPKIPDILIFYCEFSSERGPGLARRLRNLDRNSNQYPNLKYPEIYILEGGYKNFFKSYSNLCIPNAYIQMNDKHFKRECEEHHKKIKIKKYCI